jgi:renalase
MRVGIIGAGMAGLSCATSLTTLGHDVRLFDKGRGAGGRMSTRRASTPLGEVSFDHGAQYFTAREAGFRAQVAIWESRGVAARWPDVSLNAWVGTPTMSAPVKHMALEQDVSWGVRIDGLVKSQSGWALMSEGTQVDVFDAVILAIPAEQAVPILALHDFEMARAAMTASSQPCWTVMLAFDAPLATPIQVLRDRSAIGWAANNGAKPGRHGPEAWVIQGNAAWSERHLELESDEVIALLKSELANELDIVLPKPAAEFAHRWRYAMSAGTGHQALWNDRSRIGVCGDWLIGPRVESAWVSGFAVSEMAHHAALALGIERNVA